MKMDEGKNEGKRLASITVWTLLTVVLAYAMFQGWINSMGNVIILFMYYVGILAGCKRSGQVYRL